MCSRLFGFACRLNITQIAPWDQFALLLKWKCSIRRVNVDCSRHSLALAIILSALGRSNPAPAATIAILVDNDLKPMAVLTCRWLMVSKIRLKLCPLQMIQIRLLSNDSKLKCVRSSDIV